jgi:hypothetical protein
MLEINLLDETFDSNQAHNYHLSVQINENALSVCILDTVRNKYIGLRQLQYNGSSDPDIASVLKSALETEDLLKLRYKSVSNLVLNEKSTLVPTLYFDDNKKEDIYQFSLSNTLNSSILVNNIPVLGISNVFSYSNDVQKLLNLSFPGIKYYHYSTPFLGYLASKSEHWTTPKCFVNINANTIDIGIAQHKNLVFFNSFGFREYTDITFYILSVLDKYKLSPMNTDVFMSVGSKNQQKIIDCLTRYLNLIKYIQPSDEFTYSYIFDESQLSGYYNLFNLALCE